MALRDSAVASAVAARPPQGRSARRQKEPPRDEEPFEPPQSLTSFKAIAPTVIRAVEDEIEAIRTSSDVRRVQATDGVLISVLGTYFRYRFAIDEDFRVPEDAPVELIIGEEEPVPATVVRCVPDELIELSVTRALGEYVEEAFIESRLDYIWQRAAERLQAMSQDPPSPFLADAALDPDPETRFDADVDEEWGDATPVDEQREALAAALSRSVSFVHGPPGTGKSRTIGWLMKELVRRGERVIVASHTNIAVDNAMSNALKAESVARLRQEDQVIRLGEPVDENLSDIRFAEVLRRRTERLDAELRSVQQHLASLQAEQDSLQQEHGVLSAHARDVADYADLYQALEEFARRLQSCRQSRQAAAAQLVDLEARRSNVPIMGALLGLASAVTRQRLRARIAGLDARIGEAAEMQGTAARELDDLTRRLQNARVPADPGAFESRRAAVSHRLAALDGEIAEAESAARSLQETIEAVVSSVLAQARLVGATLSKICIEPALRDMRFDTLIIDELSTAPIPFVLVALALPTKRVVFFGDPNQLPPISLSESGAARFWLRTDLYSRVRNHNKVSRQLVSQRRMPPAVVSLVNEHVYGGILVTPPDIERAKMEDRERPPVEGAHILFVDTSSLNPWQASDRNYSRYNLYSAEIVSEIIGQDIIPFAGDLNAPTLRVGVICPYRAQAKLIKKLCRSRYGDLKGFASFQTVHAFQGEERDIIILDLTAGSPATPGLLLSEQRARERDPDSATGDLSTVRRLLNVAITRSKRRLVIVANKQYFERQLEDEGEFVRQLIATALDDPACRFVDGEDYLRVPSDASKGVARFLNEATFYRHLEQDAARCRSSVVIMSPFITRTRVEALSRMLTSLVGRDVKVTVVTRPLTETDFGADALKLLASWGVEIILRPRMHEKVVLLDNQVAYYGSLNVLSHRDTRETMQRLEGEEVVKLLANFADVLGPVPRAARARTAAQEESPFLDREGCERKLKKLRHKIAVQRHVMPAWVLYNKTIDAILDHRPETEDALYALLEEAGERHLRDAVMPFLDEIVAIVRLYRP